MADPFSIIASAFAMGATAATLSTEVFKLVHTFKSAREEMSDIVEQLSDLSGNLVVLGDLLGFHKSLCKPELFNQVFTIIKRFEKVRDQLLKLLDTRKSLRRIKWLFTASQAKDLLKKIESIKSSLTIVLNIIRLSNAEVVRHAEPDQTTNTQPSAPAPAQQPQNRYRKVVESVIAANRLAVERAQKEEEESSRLKKRRYDSDITRWELPDDTATWLYRLVFMTGVEQQQQQTQKPTIQATPPIQDNVDKMPGAYTVTVEDYVSDESEEAKLGKIKNTTDTSGQNGTNKRVRFEPFHDYTSDGNRSDGQKSQKSGVSEQSSVMPDIHNQLILWNQSTEPTLVVDRLLDAWTYLPHHYVKTSHTPAPGQDEAWRMRLAEKIEDYKKNGDNRQAGGIHDKRTATVEPEYEDSSDDGNPSHDAVVDSDTDQSSGERDAWDFPDGSGKEDPRAGRNMQPHYLPGNYRRASSKPRRKDRHSSPLDSDDGGVSLINNVPPVNKSTRAEPPVPRKNKRAPLWGWPSNQQYSGHAGNPITFDPSGWQANDTPFNNPFARPPSNPFMPPGSYPSIPNANNPFAPYEVPMHFPPPPPPAEHPMDSNNVHNGEAADPGRDSIPSALYEVLQHIEDKKFCRLEGLLVDDQEAREKSKIEEVQQQEVSRSAAALKDRMHDAQIAKLERLLIEQNVDQLRRQLEAEATRKAEKAEAEAKAAKAAEEDKALMEKEIRAAKAAKKAAEQTLEFMKEQAADRARKEAEERAVAERKKVDEDYKKRIQIYEDRLAAFSSEWSELRDNTLTPTPTPSCRVCASHDSGGVDIPGLSHNPSPLYLENHSRRESMYTSPNHHSTIGQARNFHGASSDMGGRPRILSPRDQFYGDAHASRSLIVLPRLDSTSTTTMQLHAKLNGRGLLASNESLKFDDDMSLDHTAFQNQLVCSTIFWEPPVLTLGSALLSTLKGKGWRPLYARVSETGQTYFLGGQPIHVNFFRSDYNPQFVASARYCETECVVIGKDLVEEYALLELGFQSKSASNGAYILDGRLTAADIDMLVDRSFMIRESGYRRLHRQLQFTPYMNARPQAKEEYAPSSASEISLSTTTSVTGGYDAQESIFQEDTPISSAEEEGMYRESPYERETFDLGLYEPDIARTVRDDRTSGTSDSGRGSLRFRRGSSKQHMD